jgi:hypothetical protein
VEPRLGSQGLEMFTQFGPTNEDYSGNPIALSVIGANLDVCPVNNPG